MSLQVRIRHSLGERWMELPPRGIDLPLVVGHSANADIQVPSLAVSPRHCVLFVHEGRWVVQDAAPGGTYVNGSRIDGASFLDVGDIISLGGDGGAPVIEIDPAGALAGGKGRPAVAATAYAAVPAPVLPAAPAPPAPFPATPAPAATGWADTPQYYTPRRRKKPDSGNGVIVGMMLTLLIAAGTGYWLYRQQQNPARIVIDPAPPSTEPAVAAPPPASTRAAPRMRPGQSETAPSLVTPAPQTAPVAVAESPMPQTATAGPTVVEDSSEAPAAPGDDADWRQVVAASQLKDEGKAIIIFEDYARTHPGAAADRLNPYTEAMLDRIWFERLEGLCEQRDELSRRIAELEKELAEETDANYKTKVAAPLREKYVALLKSVEEELTGNMKYAGKSPPNLLDDAELDRLRRTREAQYYAAWKQRVLAHIRRTHGQLPWATSKSM